MENHFAGPGACKHTPYITVFRKCFCPRRTAAQGSGRHRSVGKADAGVYGNGDRGVGEWWSGGGVSSSFGVLGLVPAFLDCSPVAKQL